MITCQSGPGLNEPAALTDRTLVPSISQIEGVPFWPCQMMSDLPSPLKSPVPLISQLGPGLVCGRADELTDYFAGLQRLGVQRFYVWFSDFAAPETIAEFGERVICA